MRDTYVRMKFETNKMHMNFNIRVTVCSGQRGVIVPRALLWRRGHAGGLSRSLHRLHASPLCALSRAAGR